MPLLIPRRSLKFQSIRLQLPPLLSEYIENSCTETILEARSRPTMFPHADACDFFSRYSAFLTSKLPLDIVSNSQTTPELAKVRPVAT